MYLISCVDTLVVVFIICVCLGLVGVYYTPVDATTSVLGIVESLVWSSAAWVASSGTKTQVVVRTGVVWSMMGWMLKPAMFLVKRWARRDRAET